MEQNELERTLLYGVFNFIAAFNPRQLFYGLRKETWRVCAVETESSARIWTGFAAGPLPSLSANTGLSLCLFVCLSVCLDVCLSSLSCLSVSVCLSVWVLQTFLAQLKVSLAKLPL